MFSPSDKLVISGYHCKVPDFFFTKSTKLGFKFPRLTRCEMKGFLTKVYSPAGFNDSIKLKIESNIIPQYNVPSVQCCYREIKRMPGNDSATILSKNCTEFENDQELDRNIEHIFVSCKFNNQEVYKMTHAVIVERKKYFERQKAKKIDHKKAYRIMMVGLNYMSRVNFPRGMPLSYGHVKEKREWFELNGYNRVRWQRLKCQEVL